MMRQLKLSVKLLRYAYGVKTCMGFFILFLFVGIGMTFLPGGNGNMWLSSYMVMVVAMWPIQLHYSMGASNMVLASPKKKELQTGAAAILNVVCFLVLYLLVLVLKWIQLATQLRTVQDVSMELLLDAMLILCIMLYGGIAYKLFVVATVLFIGIIMGTSVFSVISMYTGIAANIPLWMAVASGFVALLVGGLLQYALSLWCYKLPISKMSQLAGLRKQL